MSASLRRGVVSMCPLSVLAILSLSGCLAVAKQGLVNQVNFDHLCATENIEVVRLSKDWKSAELNVCGTRRLYHNVNPPDAVGAPNWVEVTTAGGEK